MEYWKIYNHALIPTTAPHEKPHIEEINSIRENWLFARYTTDFDCGYPTEWWYCIKDDPFDLSQLNAKRRYEINKGNKNIEIRKINQAEYAEQICKIQMQTFEQYPKKYRPAIDPVKKAKWIKNSLKDRKLEYFGCFTKNEEFVGYGMCSVYQNYVSLTEVKVLSEFMHLGTNAALMYFICMEYLNQRHFAYICDGERNIRHITNFQNYLTKYFGFRCAYCKLNIRYKFWVKFCINVLYPFKELLKNTENPLLYNVYCMLEQEKIRRSFIK